MRIANSEIFPNRMMKVQSKTARKMNVNQAIFLTGRRGKQAGGKREDRPRQREQDQVHQRGDPQGLVPDGAVVQAPCQQAGPEQAKQQQAFDQSGQKPHPSGEYKSSLGSFSNVFLRCH